jgi:hypothetical protein
MRKLLKQAKALWGRYGEKVILSAAMILVGVFSFEAGLFKGMTREAKPMTIEIPARVAAPAVAGAIAETAASDDTKAVLQSPAVPVACAFVGSRNSTLYHLPTCAAAKRIKPENRVCFTDVTDAENRGYKPGCLK